MSIQENIGSFAEDRRKPPEKTKKIQFLLMMACPSGI